MLMEGRWQLRDVLHEIDTCASPGPISPTFNVQPPFFAGFVDEPTRPFMKL